MSFSNKTPSTPVERYFKWGGAVGQLAWYDKQKEERLPVSLPFRFIVLDELSTMGGYSDKDKSGIWSNEVRSTRDDELTVRTSEGIIETGLYENLSLSKGKGAKYARSVYIAYQQAAGEDGEWVIGNIKMTGAALGAWFDFRKRANVEEVGVVLSGSTEDSKGATKFFVPTFETFDINDADAHTATELDKKLQKHLETYLNRDQDEATPDRPAPREDVVLDDIDENAPIDLSEIPF